jgi:hypothetical protein
VSPLHLPHLFVWPAQVGVTPEYTELPRNHCPRIESYPEEDRPLTICPPEADPKWRFFWRIVRLMSFMSRDS